MSTATASTDQTDQESSPLPIRLRPDLIASPQRSGVGTRWAVKDPVALNYFHFGEREWFLLQQLDGRASPTEIKNRFARQYSPTHISTDELTIFLMRANNDGLLLIDAYGQGGKLFDRAHREAVRGILTRLMSVLCIRFRGFDPERLLGFLSPIGSVLFHPVTFALVLISAVIAGLFGLAQADVIAARMPDLNWFFQGQNLLWMMVALGIVKVLHELGHGLACRRFGGECHEMGFMFLAFTPCLYCNVSDAWMLPNRWHRIVISAAGIYVELILATICLFLWYFTHPGLLNSLFLNVVLICSINTILLNGNPLLRYDGYYVLSDLVDVPNLAQQAQHALWGPITRFFRNTPGRTSALLPPRPWLVVYAICSLIYRWMIVITILWVFYKLLKEWELRAVGQLLVVVVLTSMVLPTLIRLNQFRRIPGSASMIRWIRLAVCGALLVALIGLVLSIPMPHYVAAPLIVESPQVTYVYAPVDGRLDWIVPAGSRIEPNDPLATLRNESLRQDLEAIEGRIRERGLVLKNLKLRLNQEPEVAIRVAEVEGELEDLIEQRDLLLEDIRQLSVTAPVEGVIIPGRPRSQDLDTERHLKQWEGTPLDPQNRGCLLDRGELICLIGDPTQTRLVVYVGQTDIDYVRIGQKVRVRLDQLPEQLLTGEVTDIAREEVEAAPQNLINDPEFAVRPDEYQSVRPMETSYRVIVSLPEDTPPLLQGSGGRGKIVAEESTLGRRLVRFLRRTVRFEL